MTKECESRAPHCSTHEIELVANAVRHDIVQMLTEAGSGHPGGSLSATDILSVLYFSGLMNYDPKDPKWDGRDFFILSKGHAAPALYGIIHQLGWITDDEMLSIRKLGSILQGHPDSKLCPGIEVCTGSLGQGMSVASGAALGFRLDAEKKGAPLRHVFALTGDGELQEGQNWEAAMFAAHRKLGNLCVFVDLNGLQIDGPVDAVCTLGDVPAKFRAFGWHVQEADGHDIEALEAAVKNALAVEDQPSVIICHTIKGKGVSYMENQVGWHGNAPSAEQGAQALAELEAARAELLKEAAND